MRRWVALVLLLGGCALEAAASGATIGGSVVTKGYASGASYDPVTDEDRERGYQIGSDLARPIPSPCDKPIRDVVRAEQLCAHQLWVEECGEKDKDDRPTGLYAEGVCSECEGLAKARQRKTHAGCD